MFRAGIIILLSLFLASCLGKAKHYRQYSDKGLSLAEAKSYCNSEGNVDRIAARDASAAAREAQRSSGPRTYDITGVRIDNQVHGTVRERPQASGGFATGALNSLNDNLQGLFAKRKAVRRCMMSLGYVETKAPASHSTISSQTMRQAEEIRDQMERERLKDQGSTMTPEEIAKRERCKSGWNDTLRICLGEMEDAKAASVENEKRKKCKSGWNEALQICLGEQ